MSQKKTNKSTDCNILLCCVSVETVEFDDFEDTTLARGEILLKKYEETHRRDLNILSNERSVNKFSSTRLMGLDKGAGIKNNDRMYTTQINKQRNRSPELKTETLETDQTFRISSFDIAAASQEAEQKCSTPKNEQTIEEQINEEKNRTPRDEENRHLKTTETVNMEQNTRKLRNEQVTKRCNDNDNDDDDDDDDDDDEAIHADAKHDGNVRAENNEIAHASVGKDAMFETSDKDISADECGEREMETRKVSVQAKQDEGLTSYKELSELWAAEESLSSASDYILDSWTLPITVQVRYKDTLEKEKVHDRESTPPSESRGDLPLPAIPPEPVTPCCSLSDFYRLPRAAEPQPPLEHLDSINKNEDLQELPEADNSIPVTKGNTDQLPVSSNRSDSSMMATYSGSSSEPELAELMDLNCPSDECDLAPRKPAFKPATIPLKGSMPGLASMIPGASNVLSDPLQNMSVKHSQPRLGASSLVLGPISSLASMQTPEKSAVLTQNHANLLHPTSRKLDFSKKIQSKRQPLDRESSNKQMKKPIRKQSEFGVTDENLLEKDHVNHQQGAAKVRNIQQAEAQGSAFESSRKSIDGTARHTRLKLLNATLEPQRSVSPLPKPDTYYRQSRKDASSCSTSDSSDEHSIKSQTEIVHQERLRRPTLPKKCLPSGSHIRNIDKLEDIASSRPSRLGLNFVPKPNLGAVDEPSRSSYFEVEESTRYKTPLLESSTSEKTRRKIVLKTVSSDSSSDDYMGHQQRLKQLPPATTKQNDLGVQHSPYQPKPPSTSASRSRVRKYIGKRRKVPSNTDSSDSTSEESLEKKPVQPAWGSSSIRSYALPPSPALRRDGPDTCSKMEKDRPDRVSGASTSSLPAPLPPPDLLAPSLFKRRTGQALPPVTGGLPPPRQPSRAETPTRAGHTLTGGPQDIHDRLTRRAKHDH